VDPLTARSAIPVLFCSCLTFK